MFGRDREEKQDDGASGSSGEGSDVVSIVGPGMSVEGNCSSTGSLRVEGKVDGGVEARKSVVVGEEGEVVGDIEARDAVIAGHVTGTVRAENRVELKASCRIRGDIECETVRLEEGGRVDGELRMSAGAGGDRQGTASSAGAGSAAGDGAGREVGGATRTRVRGPAAAADHSGSGGREAAKKGVEARQVDPGRPHGKGNT